MQKITKIWLYVSFMLLSADVFFAQRDREAAVACANVLTLGAFTTGAVLLITHFLSKDIFVIENDLGNQQSMKLKYGKSTESLQVYVAYQNNAKLSFSSMLGSSHREVCVSNGKGWHCLTKESLSPHLFGSSTTFIAHGDGVLTPKDAYEQLQRDNFLQQHSSYYDAYNGTLSFDAHKKDGNNLRMQND